MLQKFAMVKYGVFVAKICKHALCASTVRDIWWSPLARQLPPPCTNSAPIFKQLLAVSVSGWLRQLGKIEHAKYIFSEAMAKTSSCPVTAAFYLFLFLVG